MMEPKSIKNDDTLVITLAITMHGCVITMDIDPDSEYNVRYTSITKDNLEGHITNRMQDVENIYSLNNYYRKDTPSGENNEKVLNQMPYFDSLPYDKALTVKEHHEPITFDNTVITGICDGINKSFNSFFSTVVPLPVKLGIWVISVHKRRKPQPINDYEYIYPKDKDILTNLLNLNGLEELNKSFNNIPNLKEIIKKEPNQIKLNNDNTRIEDIRLSYLLKLLKQVIGPKCDFNIYDYTCSNPCKISNIIDKKTTMSVIEQPEVGDPESGKPPFFGGKNKTRKKHGNGPTCSKCVQSTIDNTTLPKAKLSSEMPTATKAYPVKPDMELWATLHPIAKVNEPIQTATRAGGGKKSRKMKKPRRKTRSKKSKTKKNKKSKK